MYCIVDQPGNDQQPHKRRGGHLLRCPKYRHKLTNWNDHYRRANSHCKPGRHVNYVRILALAHKPDISVGRMQRQLYRDDRDWVWLDGDYRSTLDQDSLRSVRERERDRIFYGFW